MGASGSLAEGIPQWGTQEAKASRLEWRHCSVTWGKDGKARKINSECNSFLVWDTNFFLFYLKRPSVFEVSNFSVSSQYLACGRESQIEVEDMVTGSCEKRIQHFMGKSTMADIQSSGGERKRLTSKMARLTWLSWGGICYSQKFFYHVSGEKTNRKHC